MTYQENAKAFKRVKREAQKALQKVLQPTYFDSIPLRQMIEALEAAGLRLEEDELPGILCGHEGRFSVPAVTGVDAETVLCVSWHRMEVSRRYEVIGYLS